MGVYLALARLTAWAARDQLGTARVARLWVLSLLPIAIAYHLADYFTYLLIQGQLLIRLVSDPFGFVWYLAVAAIVLGHIIAVYVAHCRRAPRVPRQAGGPPEPASHPLLVLMVGYTVVSLWIIAQPIVENP